MEPARITHLPATHWLLALTLAERAALAAAAAVAAAPGSEAARRRLREWRSQSPFQDPSWFSRRLELDDLHGEDELLAMLDLPPETFAARLAQPPAWLAGIERAWRCRDKAPPPGRGLPPGSPDFAAVAAPLAEPAIERLAKRAARLAGSRLPRPFDPAALTSQLAGQLAEWIAAVVSRTMVLELGIARLEGRLAGETPELRYLSFVHGLRDRATAVSLLSGYPVLARLLVEGIDGWLTAGTELLERFCADREMLRRELGRGAAADTLERIAGGLGDRHRGGRTVHLLVFSSGLEVLYKPRSLAIDHRFAELLGWLRQRGAPELRVPRVLDRGAYGWSELVEPRECATPRELGQFFVREGALLALLHVLHATDFHFENLIAAGEHPVLVDLETLFTGEVLEDTGGRRRGAAAAELDESVIRVMLLPFVAGDEHDPAGGIDVSGMGGDEGQLEPVPGLAFVGPLSDAMRLERRRGEIPPATNLPRQGERPVRAFDFAGDILTGFAEMYQLLRRHRDELLAAASPLMQCAGAPVRVVFRPTLFYGHLLRESLHPDLLRDAVDRDRLLDRLWHGADQSRYAGVIRRIIGAERRELGRGDVPCFLGKAGAREVCTGDGEALGAVLARSGLELAAARLGALDERQLERQSWYVKSALAAHAGRFGEQMPRPYPPPRRSAAPVHRAVPALVEAIVGRLRALALVRTAAGASEVSWVGLCPLLGPGWRLQGLGTDLYSGLPGVVLFLAYAGEVLGSALARDLAEQAFAGLRAAVAEERQQLRTLGAFAGWGGLVYTWTHLAVLWRRPELLAEAAEMLGPMGALVEKDPYFDVSHGAAGAIVPVLHLYARSGRAEALRLAVALGERVVAGATPIDGGVGWPVTGLATRALTGFSHGAAGCAWALAELHAATGIAAFRDTALAALAFEDGTYSEARRNWPDLRVRPGPGGDQPQYMAAWCHGATGIGLSRVRLMRHLPGESLLRDIEAALDATLAQGFGNNHCLCHGDLGSLELLVEAAASPAAARAAAALAGRLPTVLASIEENGWICGLPFSVESPGLMEGIAGIGYGLLRMAFPERLPSILLLDPPGP